MEREIKYKEGAQRESAQNKLNCLAELNWYETGDPTCRICPYIDDLKKNNQFDFDTSFLENMNLSVSLKH